MFAAVLTTFFFACSAILARRSATLVGSQPANLARQGVALVLLGLWAHLAGQGLRGPGLGVFVVSGVIGFGMGDWAMFEALPRIGAALTILLVQCLAAPIGAVTEWLWLGTRLSPWQIAGAATILAGVAVAMTPERDSDVPHGHRVAGIVFAVISAFGQAWGAVITRLGFKIDDAAGLHLDGPTSAYQRLWGGIVCIALVVGFSRIVAHSRKVKRPPREWKRATPWILGNAVAGPVLGVSCYQWGLHVVPSAVVLPIVATTPLVVTALAFGFEKTRPSLRTLLGSVLAVVGVIVLVVGSSS
jgi:drug/metabolite transporter (DMT)-like permease